MLELLCEFIYKYSHGCIPNISLFVSSNKVCVFLCYCMFSSVSEQELKNRILRCDWLPKRVR